MSKELQIRNSTVDFLVFTRDAGEDGIEVRVQNGDVWLTQKAISQLFDVDRSVITKHLSNIFKEGELDENSVCAKFAQTADDGKTYNYKFYSLAAIIAVGYRINSERATQFRTWATKVLDTFTKQGYVLDKSRLINGQIFDEDYFEHLIAEIQEIRASERRFYQKITDIYATAVDYDKNSQMTREFYATVQNKIQREEIFKKLPAYAHVERLYKEEKLYDRLLTYVLNSPGIYALQEYEKVLKKEYPEQILNKYMEEVNKMAMHTSDRKHYAYLVSLLQKMQRMKGGVKLVEQIAAEWKVKYNNRPAMMDELRKLYA